MSAELLTRLLAHPDTRGLDIDDPATTMLRRDIIRRKPFLRDVYRDWYDSLISAVPTGPGALLELGSGAGFLSELVPDLITSDVFFCPFVKAVLDGQALPFGPGVLRGVVMTNVLHHVSRPHVFLAEAARCVRPGGVIAMVEPWVSPWSRLIYTHLHHEPFVPGAASSAALEGGPLSGANSALPWILFHRERSGFECRCRQWRVETVAPTMPFRYLLSGGVSLRSLMPAWATGFWRGVERRLHDHIDTWAMFALIVLRRTGEPTDGGGPS